MTINIYPKTTTSSTPTDVGKYAVLPYTFQDTKDESLGSATITLLGLKRKKPFKPYCPVEIIDDTLGNEAQKWLLAEDKVTNYLSRENLYKHELTLIEQTKLLELYMMGAKRFTQPINREYNTGIASGSSNCFTQHMSGAEIDYSYWMQYGEKKLDLASTSSTYVPSTSFGITSSPIYKAYNINYTMPTMSITTMETVTSGATYCVFLYKSDDGMSATTLVEHHETQSPETTLSITPPAEAGTYFFYYFFSYDSTTSYCYCVPFSIIENGIVLSDYTLKDYCNQLFDLVQPITTSDTPKFSLTDDAETILDVTAPEMSFTDGATLWENLSQIGKVIQYRPKLIIGSTCEVDFEKIGSRNEHALTGCKLVQNELNSNASEYANKVVATVSNMKNYDANGKSTIAEPSASGTLYKSLRTTSDTVRIKEENGIIETSHNIEAVLHLYCILPDADHTVVDLTNYVFEASEYALLSSYSAVYPTSKIYAIYYTKGSKNIDGLWYRAQDSTISFFNQFEWYSIKNIIQAVSGYELGSSDYVKLAFRVEYISSIDAIVENYKDNPLCSDDIAITTTQNTNEPNSSLMGAGLHGEASMLGNDAETRTYIAKSVSLLPTINNTIDGKFVTVATYQVFRNYAICTCSLTENYNELSAYNRISKEIRQYEIPDGQNRNFLMRSFLQIIPTSTSGQPHYSYYGGSFHNANAYESVLKSLTANTGNQVGNMFIKFKDESGNDISEVLLPCMAIPIGNSILFYARCSDNYAVGYKSQEPITTTIVANAYRYLQAVRCGDANYGRAKSMQLTLTTNVAVSTSSYSDELSISHSLPEKPSANISSTTEAQTGDLLVWKDGGETLVIGWQLNIISPSCIISPNFASVLAFANAMTRTSSAKIYFFNKLLNPDLSNCTNAMGSSDLTSYQSGTFLRFSASSQFASICTSWAVKDEATSKFLFGQNSTFGGYIYIAFNDIYDYGESSISLT